MEIAAKNMFSTLGNMFNQKNCMPLGWVNHSKNESKILAEQI